MSRKLSWTASDLRVYLCLYEFSCDPAEITKALGVEPTATAKTGDLRARDTILKHKCNSWDLDSALVGQFDVDEHVSQLMKRVPDLDRVRRLDPAVKAQLTCVVHLFGDDNRPTLSLSHQSMAYLAKLGASYDIDYYLIGGDESSKDE